MGESISLSPALENYLEAILNLSEKNGTVHITDLAEYMQVAKASVSQAINTLVSLHMIKHEKYGPIEFTLLGKREAEKIREKHCILKRFLVEILQVNPHVAEKDACLMEHVVSEGTLEKLITFLQSQLQEPLHRERGIEKMSKAQVQSLNELRPGTKGKVIRVAAQGFIRRRILDMGLVPGTEVSVEGVAPLGDPMEIKVRGYMLTLRKSEASHVFVEVTEYARS